MFHRSVVKKVDLEEQLKEISEHASVTAAINLKHKITSEA